MPPAVTIFEDSDHLAIHTDGLVSVKPVDEDAPREAARVAGGRLVVVEEGRT